jgi:hypothetical protein
MQLLENTWTHRTQLVAKSNLKKAPSSLTEKRELWCGVRSKPNVCIKVIIPK